METESENSPESLSKSHNLPEHYDNLSKTRYQ